MSCQTVGTIAGPPTSIRSLARAATPHGSPVGKVVVSETSPSTMRASRPIRSTCSRTVEAVERVELMTSASSTGVAGTSAARASCLSRSSTADSFVAASIIQRAAPSAMLGRVMSLLVFAGLSLQPLGQLSTGWSIEAGWLTASFVIAASVMAVTSAVALTSKTLRDL